MIFRNRALLAVSVAVAAAYTGIGMVVPVRVLYAQSHGASLGVIGAMASSYLLANFAFQYPAGALSDRIGRKPLMLTGLVVQAILTLVYLAVSDPLLFVGLRFLEGIVGAAVLSPARALIADAVPEDQRGEAYGIFSAFFNAGFLLGPGIGGLLASTGYSSAFIGSFACRLGAAVIVAIVIHERTPARRRKALGIPTTHRGLFTRALLGAYILAFGDYLWLGFDMTLMPLWLRHHLGASIAAIGLAYATWAVPSMIVSPIGGRIADRVRRSHLILIFGLAQVPFYVAYGLLTQLAIVIIAIGLHSAVYSLTMPAVDAYLASASPPDARARAQSLYSSVGLASAFLASAVLPALYAVNYRLPIFAVGALFGLCIVVGGLLVRRSEFALPQTVAGVQAAGQ
ncbi:MAG: MFS transporter [Chloroflexota bacterium]|nr:MFS transporter [Chloroflexota bacterium]